MENESFELENGKFITGYRIKTKENTGFDCFLALSPDHNNMYTLFNESTGTEIAVCEGTDLDVIYKKVVAWVKDPINVDLMAELYKYLVQQEKLLNKFCKDVKIMYKLDKRNIVFDKIEYIDKFIKEFNLNKHFRTITNHAEYESHYAQNNTCYVFCHGLIVPTGNVVDKKTFMFEEDKVPFSDVFDMPALKYKGNVSRTLTLTHNFLGKNIIIGYYIYDMNTLVLSDISHSKDFEWVKGMMDYLKTVFVKDNFVASNKLVVTLGSDPEFELFIDGKNSCGPEINKSNANRLRSKIGTDGCGRQMEIRPDPKNTPEEAVDEISDILSKISYHEIRCDGVTEPLGGHLHFGISKDGINGKIKHNDDITKILDKFIGEKVQKFSSKRRTGEYGHLGDIRVQPWGFEYRTPPAAIFFSKEMARICYKIGKNLIQSLVDNGKIEIPMKVSKKEYLEVAGLTENEYQYFIDFEGFYEKNKTKSIIENWTEIKESPLTLKFYDKWSDEVRALYKKILYKSVCTQPMTICMYGIKETRGTQALAGIKGCGSMITHPKDSHCDEGISIGLGIFHRMNNDITTLICNEIRMKIGIANASEQPITTQNLFPEEMLNRSDRPNNRRTNPGEAPLNVGDF